MSDVTWGPALTRFPTLWPGQFGVPGTDMDRGERLHCTGEIFYVDPNFPGVSDARDGTSPTNPLQTVATALTKCQPFRGDTIAVMANNAWYHGDTADLYVLPIEEEVTVDVPGVKIVGLNPSSSNGVVWTPASDAGTCITVQALDVLIEGFVFTEGNTYAGCDAILAEWDDPPYGDNLTVRHCVFDDTVDVAIELDFSWYAKIHDNTFWECNEHGILVDLAKANGAQYGRIYDNVFHDCAVAMELLGDVRHFHIFRNSIYNGNAEGGGAAAAEGITTAGGGLNQVFDNWFSCLLPGPGNGDWDDLNTASATDAWIGNRCLNGPNVTNPT